MLQDMWYTSGVWRVRLEPDAEHIILVVSCHVQIVGARLVVLKVQRRELELGHMFGLLEGKSMDAVSRLRQGREVGHGGIMAACRSRELLQARIRRHQPRCCARRTQGGQHQEMMLDNSRMGGLVVNGKLEMKCDRHATADVIRRRGQSSQGWIGWLSLGGGRETETPPRQSCSSRMPTPSACHTSYTIQDHDPYCYWTASTCTLFSLYKSISGPTAHRTTQPG